MTYRGPFGVCQLMCGEPATVSVCGFAIGEACYGRIQQIAQDAGVPFDPALTARKTLPRLIRKKHKPPTTARGLVHRNGSRVCASCRRSLPVKVGPMPKRCPRCGGRTQHQEARRAG
jgi:predicted RNA-binding Zn-ribbon protein involved in translation (DUF1610 family)